MSIRPSDMIRRDCDVSQSCDAACNNLVFGTEISGLSFIRRLQRNGVRGQITGLTQGANRTTNDRILSPSYPVFNANNALQNLQALTVKHINSNDASEFDETSGENSGPFDLTETRTITYYAPTGVIGGTLGSYMINRVGRWDYEISGQAIARIFRFFREFTTPTEFNSANLEWAKRVSRILSIPLVSNLIGLGPGILDHNEMFLKPVNALSNLDNIDGFDNIDFIDNPNDFSTTSTREIGLLLYERVLEGGADIKANVRNIQFNRTSTPGLFNVTIDNVYYPNSKLTFKLSPLLRVKLTHSIDSVPASYRLVIPFPSNGQGFANSDFYNRLLWAYGGNTWMNPNTWSQNQSHGNCGGSCGGSCSGCRSGSSSGCGCGKSGPCGCHRDRSSNRCFCPTGTTGNSGTTGLTSGIDFSQITPDADLIYAFIGLSTDSPFACNRSINNSNVKPQWNIEAYVTSEDLYNTSPGGSFSQPGSLLLVIDGQHLANRRRISYDLNGDELNVLFNSDSVECNSAMEFATISSGIIYALTAVKIPPRVLLKVNTVCTPNGECDVGSLITNTPPRVSNLVFLTDTISLLYNSSSTSI